MLTLRQIARSTLRDLKPEHLLASIFLVVALFLYLPRVEAWDTFKWPILLPAAFFWTLLVGNRRVIPQRWLAGSVGLIPVALLLGILALHVARQPGPSFNGPYFYALSGRFLIHMAVVACFAWIVQHRHLSGFTATQVIKSWLPFVLMALIYENMHDIVVTLNPRIMDPLLIEWDLKWFGMHHSVWMEKFVSAPLNDFFSAAYHTYLMYPMFLGFSLYRNPGDRETRFRQFMLAYLYSCYIGFAGYILVPGIGPYYGLANLYTKSLEGGWLTQLNSYLYHSFSNMRDIFPSLHTSNTIVCLVTAYRYRRKLFWPFLLPALSLVISTIYLRYHYTIDIVAGILLAPIACALGEKTDAAWAWLKAVGERLHPERTPPLSSGLAGNVLHPEPHLSQKQPTP